MTPEEKATINAMLKQMGETRTIDELDSERKRCVRLLREWSCQDADARKALPNDIKDAKMITHYAVLLTLDGGMTIIGLMGSIDMAIEAAYNLGKAAPKS